MTAQRTGWTETVLLLALLTLSGCGPSKGERAIDADNEQLAIDACNRGNAHYHKGELNEAISTSQASPITQRQRSRFVRYDMIKPHSYSVVVIVLMMPMVLSSAEHEAAPNRQAAMETQNRSVGAFMNENWDLAITCFTAVHASGAREV